MGIGRTAKKGELINNIFKWKRGKRLNIHFKFRISTYIIISMFVLSIVTVGCYYIDVDLFFDNLMGISYFDILVGQIANTLIVLSLTSVLSSNFGQVYWVDIKDTKLVTPFWSCFIGITVYLLTALVFSIGAYVLGMNAGIVVSSIFAIILLIFLTFKMISIYFGKEELKKQLFMEYKYMLIQKNYHYASDYLFRMKKYVDDLENSFFVGKRRIYRLRKEIKEIEKDWDSGNRKLMDNVLNSQINKFVKSQSDLGIIDLKIEEYTKNAIKNNEGEVVRENIQLLLECENYILLIKLLEELFEWDEQYTCRILKDLSEKGEIGIIKDRLNYFKQYALRKLITESGKLEAIQNLLLVYDNTNMGMSGVKDKLEIIQKKSKDIYNKRIEISNKVNDAEDIIEAIKKEREVSRQLDKQDEVLAKELSCVLEKTTTKELRSFYLPLREMNIAYDEGKYEIVNNYIKVIIECYKQDLLNIRMLSGVAEIKNKEQMFFSYVVDDESCIIQKLLEKDKDKRIISEEDKLTLLEMKKVTI